MELQLEAIINSLDDAIVSVDESARVVFLNDAAARVFRCERDQVVGQPWRWRRRWRTWWPSSI